MDKLQHIDELLKKSASTRDYAKVDDNDWMAVEKKLKHRKNRIYAYWFFLALVLGTSVTFITQNVYHQSNKGIVKVQKNKNPIIIDQTPNKEKELNQPTSGLKSLDITPLTNTSPTKIRSKQTDLNTINTNITKIKYAKIPSITIDEIKGESKIKITTPAYISKIEYKPSIIKKNYVEIGFSFTPSISNKVASENTTLSGLINRNFYNNVLDNEGSSFASSQLFSLQYHLNNRFFISSGLGITQKAESISYNYTITETPWSNNNTIEYYIPLAAIDYKKIDYVGSNSYHFIEIPLNVGFKTPLSPNFEIRGQMGASYLKLVQTVGKKASFYDLGLQDLNDLNLNQNNLSANVKIGLYHNRRMFTVGVEPIISYNLNSLTDNNSAIKLNPYNYGLNISTQFKINN